jgi:hypothetical protein
MNEEHLMGPSMSVCRVFFREGDQPASTHMTERVIVPTGVINLYDLGWQ